MDTQALIAVTGQDPTDTSEPRVPELENCHPLLQILFGNFDDYFMNYIYQEIVQQEAVSPRKPRVSFSHFFSHSSQPLILEVENDSWLQFRPKKAPQEAGPHPT